MRTIELSSKKTRLLVRSNLFSLHAQYTIRRCTCVRLANLAPQRFPKRSRPTAGAAEEEAGSPPQLKGDWRTFRAGLIAKTEEASGRAGTPCGENLDLLKRQSPSLAEEPTWAHSVEQLEPGAVLLATSRAPGLLNDPRMWQLTVFLLEHNHNGSKGLILNRPAVPNLGDLLPSTGLQGDLAKLRTSFSEASLYLGGMYSPNKMSSQKLTVLHPHEQLLNRSNGQLVPCKEVISGLFVGGEIAGAEAVESGTLAAETFRFFAGTMEWGPGQLLLEVQSGIWHTAACSRNLVAKQCLQLPVPLWREVMVLMGGSYAQEARQEETSS